MTVISDKPEGLPSTNKLKTFTSVPKMGGPDA